MSGKERALLEKWETGRYGADKQARAKRKLSAYRKATEGVDEAVLSAFWFLNRARTYAGFGYPQGIPLQEMVAYLDEFGVSHPDARRRYLRFLSALDAEYQRISSEQLSKANKTPERKEAEQDG